MVGEYHTTPSNWAFPHADALYKAKPPEQRMDYTPPAREKPTGDPLEQMVKLEREMSQVQTK